MKRLTATLGLVLLAAACDDAPNVIVRAELDGAPVTELPVWVLPYDRQAVLDSLAERRKRPEPVPPQELVLRLDSLRAARSVLPPGDSLAPRLDAAIRAATDTVRSYEEARRAWADTTYADFAEAVKARTARSGATERVDTTGTDGSAAFAVDGGSGWVHARYVLPDAELEWLVPVEPVEGDTTVVRLDARNARRRPLR